MNKSNILRVGNVSYINSLPFRFGLKNFPQNDIGFDIIADVPRVLTKLCIENKIDVGILPVASLLENTNLEAFGNHCIACDNKVHSVLLLSNHPINEIDAVIEDKESITSNLLAKTILKEFYKQDVRTVKPNSNNSTNTKTCQVIIGDKAIDKNLRSFKYSFDLSEMWKKNTGLPFVFALWIKKTDYQNTDNLKIFEQAIEFGIKNIKQLLEENKQLQIHKNYLLETIQYTLTPERKKGLHLFLQLAKNVCNRLQ